MKKIVIVEDEHYNQTILQGFIKELRPDYMVVKILDKVDSCVEYFETSPDVDLIFMDIQLVDGVCFSIFDRVCIEVPVIFTTAYDEYAVKAFEVNSVDYLLKPIDQEKLEQSIRKFEQFFDHKSDSTIINYQELSRCIVEGNHHFRQRLLAADGWGFEKIDVDRVAYIHSQEGICEAFLFDGTRRLLNHTLEKLEQQLSPELFFRANRQVILNINSVRRFETHFAGKLAVRLLAPFDQKPVMVSRLKATEFKMWVDR